MAKTYEYIELEIMKRKRKDQKTDAWKCKNKNGNYELGVVKWYSAWRQYCYFPSIPAIYSSGCLADIQDFIDGEMKARVSKPDPTDTKEGVE